MQADRESPANVLAEVWITDRDDHVWKEGCAEWLRNKRPDFALSSGVVRDSDDRPYVRYNMHDTQIYYGIDMMMREWTSLELVERDAACFWYLTML